MTTIAVIGTLDTKGPELAFLCGEIVRRGVQPLVIDTSLFAHDAAAPDVTADEVAERAGTTLARLRDANDRGDAVRAMGTGARVVVAGLHARGKIDGAVAAGGSGNTSIAASAMHGLPIGVPKLIVSTMAAGDVSAYVGTSDITLMHSVSDIEGLNRLSRTILGNAAAAICGMAAPRPAPRTAPPPAGATVALTMFGVTTAGAKHIRALLEARGFEVVVFHAVGAGGRAMERLIGEGMIAGVIDLTTTEIADEVVGGVLGAGPDRLRAAVARGIPQVVAPGALDMVNFGPRSSIPARFEHRHLFAHNPQVTLMRTTPEENVRCAQFIARQLADADPESTTVCLPLRGVSALDAEGERFFDLDADQHLFDELTRLLGHRLPIVRVEAHINDAAFADEVVSRFLGHWSRDHADAQTPPEAVA
ncbi:Tm-1-like ATP-binding domain-containing protein [soil metagenome]